VSGAENFLRPSCDRGGQSLRAQHSCNASQGTFHPLMRLITQNQSSCAARAWFWAVVAVSVRAQLGAQAQMVLPDACAMHGCDPTGKRHVMDEAPSSAVGRQLVSAWRVPIPFLNQSSPLDHSVECLMSSAGSGPIVCGGGGSMVVGPDSQRFQVFKLSAVTGATLLVAQVPRGSPSPVIPTSGVLAGAWNGSDVTTLYVDGTPIWDRMMQPQAPDGATLWAAGLVASKYLSFTQGGTAAKLAPNQLFVYSASGVPVAELCLSAKLGIGEAVVASPPVACPLGSSCTRRFFTTLLGSSCPRFGGRPCLALTAVDIGTSIVGRLSIGWTSEILVSDTIFPAQPVVLDPLSPQHDGMLVVSAMAEDTLFLWGFNSSFVGEQPQPLWNLSVSLGSTPPSFSNSVSQTVNGSWSVWTAALGSDELIVTFSSVYWATSSTVKSARVVLDTALLEQCSGYSPGTWTIASPAVLASSGNDSSIVVSLSGSAYLVVSARVPSVDQLVAEAPPAKLAIDWCALSSGPNVGGQPLLIPSSPAMVLTAGTAGVEAWYR
jgi:hypothetical protein